MYEIKMTSFAKDLVQNGILFLQRKETMRSSLKVNFIRKVLLVF